MENIAFLGLGVMGYPMAGHLQKAGYHVRVYNRTTSKAKKWCSEYGGEMAPTPAEAARDVAVVFSCVGNDDDVLAVTLGEDGAFASMAKGAVFVDHATTSATLARTLAAEAQALGFGFIDAPVSGGQAGAESGRLTVMCGGDMQHYEKISPIISHYAILMRLLGAAGAGQLCKMVNQICLAGVLQGLAEGIAFGQKAGLNMESVLTVISKGAAGSWQMDNRGASMLKGEFNYGFAVDWMRKDLGICLDEAKKNGARLPVTALIDQFYSDIQAIGGNRQDTSSLIRRL